MKCLRVGIVHMGKARCCIRQGTQSFIPQGVKNKELEVENLVTFCHIVQNHGFIFICSLIFMDLNDNGYSKFFDSFGPPGQWKATGF